MCSGRIWNTRIDCMRISASSELTGMNEIPSGPRSKTAAAAPGLGEDKLEGTQTEALERAQAQTPVVRPEKVAQARALIQDPGYPSADVLGQVASLLANHLTTPPGAEGQ